MAKKEQVTIEDARLLTREQAADLIGITPDCLKRWTAKRKGPRAVRWSAREIRYPLRDLLHWQSLLTAVEPKEL